MVALEPLLGGAIGVAKGATEPMSGFFVVDVVVVVGLSVAETAGTLEDLITAELGPVEAGVWVCGGEELVTNVEDAAEEKGLVEGEGEGVVDGVVEVTAEDTA